MNFGHSSSNSSSYGQPNAIPMFETFHQSPHGEFRTSFYNPFEVKTRKRTKKSQFKVLERTFHENPKPNSALRKQLAQELGMTPRGVQVWFQNRRAKAKNQRMTEEKSERDTVTSGNQMDDELHSDEIITSVGNPLLDTSTQFALNGIDYESTNPNDFDSSHSTISLGKPSQSLDRTRDSVLFSAFDLNTAYFTSQESSKSLEASHFTNSHGEMVRKPRQKPSPEAIKIASTPEQYEMMMHQHKARREQQQAPLQQRKRSLESQLYYHQQGYSQLGEENNRLQQFRGRANSLPGQKVDCTPYGSMSAGETSGYSTDMFSPMSGIMTSSEATPLTPMTAASMPEQIHNYMGSYNSGINHGLHTPNEAGDSQRSGVQLPMVMNSTRRNSCPPEFMAAFVDMNYMGDEKPHLATIVEDEANTGYQQDLSQSGSASASNGFPSQSRYIVGMNQYQRATMSSSSAGQIQRLDPNPDSMTTHEFGYERLKTRRLSEPRLNKFMHPIEEQPQVHDSMSVNSTTSLLRGHSLDSTMWQNERNLRRY